jgi:undecaprenyl-diphosphatase
VHTLLHSIQSADLSIYHFLSGFAGNEFLDRLLSKIESTDLLKGGLFLAAYWYLWFRSGPDRQKRREAIVVILIGVMFALVLARTIAFATPFRLRPVYDPAVQHHAYAWPVFTDFEAWSAFPSDTATYFFALACGIAWLARRLAIPVMLFTAVWICLPRMYYGIHYASDMVAGAVIGITVVWFALRIGWLRSRLASKVLAAADATPSVSYAVAFLASFEMATTFDDIRDVARALIHAARLGLHLEIVTFALIVFTILGLVAGGASMVFLYRESLRRNSTCT